MTTAWTSSGSISGSNEDDLMTRQSCFVGNHPLELLKRPSVELRPLFSTATLAAVADTAEIFQHNQAIGWKTIDEAAANGMQVVACPTAFLVAKPCPSAFRSRAFALQNAASGTEPLAPLYRLHTRNLDTVRSDQQVNLTKINTHNTLRWIAWFGDWNEDGNVQIEFSVPMTLENSKSGVRRSENWEIALSDFDSALDSFTITSGDAHPDFIVFPEQAEESRVQVQRLRSESQRFHGSLFSLDGFVCFRDAFTSTDGIISKEVESLSDLSVSQVMQSDGIETSLVECDPTNSIASSSEHFERSFQSLFVLCRQVEFTNNGQFHHTNYTTRTRICQVAVFRCCLKTTACYRRFL
jgi:hypothetical protein